eukprot:1563726-Amphidinium_carterae.1
MKCWFACFCTLDRYGHHGNSFDEKNSIAGTSFGVMESTSMLGSTSAANRTPPAQPQNSGADETPSLRNPSQKPLD